MGASRLAPATAIAAIAALLCASHTMAQVQELSKAVGPLQTFNRIVPRRLFHVEACLKAVPKSLLARQLVLPAALVTSELHHASTFCLLAGMSDSVFIILALISYFDDAGCKLLTTQ